MPATVKPSCARAAWQGREAYVLENDLVRLVSLTGGGHVAEFRFLGSTGLPTLSPLWVPPWKTIEPYLYKESVHARRYGPALTGKTISGIAGHNVCLDYFGAPSEDEVRQGLSIHGEAPTLRWKKTRLKATPHQVTLELGVRLPAAGLRFRRQITLERGEAVAYFAETVTNERRADHFFHWVQHVTLGPPFLAPGGSRIFAPGIRGRTFPHGYEGKALLRSEAGFRWPMAPGANGGVVDLTRPFLQPGLGFVATLLLDPRKSVVFISALNNRHGLLFAYCFRREDFPWTAVWEENKARTEPPWSGACQARGLEFGSTPFPVGRREAFSRGSLFRAPSFSVVPGKGHKRAGYIAFLARVTEGFERVTDIRVAPGRIQVRGVATDGVRHTISLPAARLAEVGLL